MPTWTISSARLLSVTARPNGASSWMIEQDDHVVVVQHDDDFVGMFLSSGWRGRPGLPDVFTNLLGDQVRLERAIA
ncbi:hypothetical protein K2224_37575 (plasmid) [Streptomyces sp. BHT-5-2]|uniref:hypothetical protein n=1 Tax=unclassified Streptomyces TaxID=2593676 RepID=UPI001C8EE921|nr:hypothetical protein [Streptomyces sp. BHT-5-2]QZL08754.1 hypothetical protein K2224_37575 [Streptomyces sp. BHT-5-2]